MGVDLDVALTLEGQVEGPVTGRLLHQVVEERQAGADLDAPARVEVDLRAQARLPGVALHARDALPLARATQAAPPPRARGRSAPRGWRAPRRPPAASRGRPG